MAAKRPTTRSRRPKRAGTSADGATVAPKRLTSSGEAVDGGTSEANAFGGFPSFSAQARNVRNTLRQRVDWAWLMRALPSDVCAPLADWSDEDLADLVVWVAIRARTDVSADAFGLHPQYSFDEVQAAEAIGLRIAEAHATGLPLNRTEAVLGRVWRKLAPDAAAYRRAIRANVNGARSRKGTNRKDNVGYLDVFTAFLDEYHPEDTRPGSEGLRGMFNSEGSELPDMMDTRGLRFDDKVRKRMESDFRRWLSEYRAKKDSKRFVDARKRNEDRKKKPRTVKLMGD